MMKRYEHLSIESLIPQFQKWIKVFDRKEVGNVFFLPNTGILHRTHQMVDWYQEEVELIDIKARMLTEPTDLYSSLSKMSNKRVVLIVYGELFGSGGMRLAEMLRELYLTREEGMLVVHEGVYSELSSEREWPMVIHQNKWQYQLPNKDAVSEYLDQVLADWQVKMSKGDREWVVRYCGGYLWLVNELIRLRGESGEASMEELMVVRSMEDKKELIWKSMSGQYQKALMGGKVSEEVVGEIREYGLLDQDGGVEIEWLREYASEKKKGQLVIDKDQVVYMGRNLTSELSERERVVLARLYEGEGVVRREELGEAFWGDDDYSDWSLDQMVSRLRGKIKRIKLPVKILTKKGKGYELGRS